VSSKARKRYTGYPHGKIRAYWSAAITVLSLILALLMLGDRSLSLLYYLVLTVLLTAAVLTLKMRFSRVKTRDPLGEDLSETESGGQRWRSLLMLFGMLIVFLLLPLLLAPVHPEFWFISLISYTTSVSTAEVLFFLITKKG